MIKSYFYDTNALITGQERIFDQYFYISFISIKELEKLKISNNEDEATKNSVKNIIRLLRQNYDKYQIIFPQSSSKNKTNDALIIESYLLAKENNPNIKFCTNDFGCSLTAAAIYGIPYEDIVEFNDESKYCGYQFIQDLTEDDLANFYMRPEHNCFQCLTNEYIYLVQTKETYIWTGEKYEKVFPCTFKSKHLGNISPCKDDPMQIMAMDSLKRNKLTVLRGRAGSGKSLLALSYLFDQLERGKISKIVIFCNTVAVMGAAKLGFYPGSRNEKLLDSQIGNFLYSKLGGPLAVEELINEGELELIPVADVRGYDTSGMNAGIYITEAQNFSKEMAKLVLQRVGDDSICILDGDDSSQVDAAMYSGRNNGLKRVVEIFKGQDFFGTVKLVHIHRSKIAQIADSI